MQAQEFVEKLYKVCEARGIEQFEVFYSCRESSSLNVFEQEVINFNSNENQHVNLKIKLGKKIGSFSCEELEPKNLEMMIDKALANAQIVDNEDESFLHDGSGEYKKVEKLITLKDKLENLDKIAFLKELETKAYAENPLINKVINCSFSQSSSKFIMKNSLGLDVSEETDSASARIYLSAKKADNIKTGGWVTIFCSEEDFDADKLVKKAVEEAVKKLDAVDIKSQVTNVIFEHSTFATFIRTILGIFSANTVQHKRSKLAGKLGQKIASEKLTLIDNPLMAKNFGTTSFDGEGYPCYTKDVIKDGVLKTYLYNLKTANKDNVKSTGNSSGGEGVAVGNFYVQPGNLSLEELLKKLGKGVYIDDLQGLHAGLNITSGDFSFGAEGFLVEDGKITKALNQFTIAGNIYDLLMNIEEVASNLEFEFSQFGSPAVLVKNISIANS